MPASACICLRLRCCLMWLSCSDFATLSIHGTKRAAVSSVQGVPARVLHAAAAARMRQTGSQLLALPGPAAYPRSITCQHKRSQSSLQAAQPPKSARQPTGCAKLAQGGPSALASAPAGAQPVGGSGKRRTTLCKAPCCSTAPVPPPLRHPICCRRRLSCSTTDASALAGVCFSSACLLCSVGKN